LAKIDGQAIQHLHYNLAAAAAASGDFLYAPLPG